MSQARNRAGGPAETGSASNSSDKLECPDDGQPGSETGSHPAAHGGGLVGLAVGALGVVFGDIGTSPLYSLQTVFHIDGAKIHPTTGDVYGVISVMFWSITLIVSVKYVAFILRADNDGEGGVMALAAFVRRFTGTNRRLIAAALLLGVVGASLFYGDSVITPAISVLSAVEGVEVASPDLHDVVLPIGVAIVAVLFLVQRFGTHRVGRLFGPVMVLWFVVIGAIGLVEVVRRPDILRALSPQYVVTFVADHPFLTFVALGAVVLCVTGAEALYADMGHFGRAPIRYAWFALAFPCLTLNYLGQGALVLHEPSAVSNPFYLLVPGWSRIPVIVLATLATVIASQAVISGAYSMSRQAIRLGFLPNLTVRQTSAQASGQIYVPAVNWLLFGSVLVVILGFRSSNRLATAYGLAVTGTFLITTTLFIMVAALVWKWARWKIIAFAVVYGIIEISYFAANVIKVETGGWLPLVVAVAVIVTMTTWQAGRRIVTRRREEMEGSLPEFIEQLQRKNLPRPRGTAVFLHPTKETTPLALRQNVRFNHVLHDHVVVMSVHTENVPYVPRDERITVDDLAYADDGIVHLEVRFGFQDDRDIPRALAQAVGMSNELNIDARNATFFLSRLTIGRGDGSGMSSWRKRLFVGLAHNAANPAASFHLPEDRTVVMGAHLEL